MKLTLYSIADVIEQLNVDGYTILDGELIAVVTVEC